jgi:hypothetical protein
VKNANAKYDSIMEELLTKYRLVKVINEILDSTDLNDDISTFGFDRLIDSLVEISPTIPPLLLKHGAFIVDQVHHNIIL